ncbi:hypothetical protein IKF03_00645, partial [Candidatus Saccharibacteria bacterium]|nr:hypothetical protein [Candidatus Saccharibacteria bacterium]
MKISRYIYIYILVALLGSALLTSNKVFAESSPASVVIPASYCNVSTGSSTSSGSSNTTDTPHVATINNGTYKEDIGITTFKVVCGDNGGYSIYAIGYSNNEYGNNKLLATVGNTLSPS